MIQMCWRIYITTKCRGTRQASLVEAVVINFFDATALAEDHSRERMTVKAFPQGA
jgi:hypothetical protein